MGMNYGKNKNNKKVHENKPEPDVLYVVLPYFNFCHYKRRTQLFLEFIERNKTNKDIRMIVSEGKHSSDSTFELPNKIDGVFSHFRFDYPDKIWIKENLINLAIERLPSDWKYVAWVDADITFLNNNWAKDAMNSFENGSDVIQLFQSAVNLGPEGETVKLDQGFIYMHQKSGKPYTKTYKYGFWHPGYTLAFNRKAYAAMDGVFDIGILGSGDHHVSLALIGQVDKSHPGGLTNGYKSMLQSLEERCNVNELKLDYVKGTILHHFHGHLENRKYRERWDILVKGEYNPVEDIMKDKMGIISLTAKGKRLASEIQRYFEERKEDEA